MRDNKDIKEGYIKIKCSVQTKTFFPDTKYIHYKCQLSGSKADQIFYIFWFNKWTKIDNY